MIKPKSRIKEIKPSIDEYKTNDWRLKLDKNENLYGTSKFAVSALKNCAPEEISLYPFYKDYREKFARIYDINPEKILFINSPDSAIWLINNTYLEEGDKFIFCGSCDEKTALYALSAGGNVEFAEFGENFEIDIEKLKNKLKGCAKICHISSPNNLTGQLLRASIIAEFLKEFPETLFVVDLSSIGFAENVILNDYTDLVDNYSNIIIIKSFANDYALAGVGVGIIVSDCKNIEALKILIPNYTVSACSLNCAISAINDTGYFEEIKNENTKAREILYEGLIELGYKAFKSDSNCILCDFGEYCDFYYTKLKNNGVIVKKFNSDSVAHNCLRITVPKPSGVKFLLQLLKTKDLLIFAYEDTLADVRKSYNEALVKTFEYFANYRISFDKIKEIKRLDGCNSFDALHRLLLEEYININPDDIEIEFKNIFYNSSIEDDNYLINNDKLLIEKEILDQLSLNFDMALVTLRNDEEISYSLKKFGLEKYFSFVGKADSNIQEAIKKLPRKDMSFIAANEEILSLAKGAGIRVIALIAKENNNSDTINNLKHYGADDLIYENENILKYFELSV